MDHSTEKSNIFNILKEALILYHRNTVHQGLHVNNNNFYGCLYHFYTTEHFDTKPSATQVETISKTNRR
jgi:hypothetical protein